MGATTPEGKEASKMNAMKSGAYSAKTKELCRWIRESGRRERDAIVML